MFDGLKEDSLLGSKTFAKGKIWQFLKQTGDFRVITLNHDKVSISSECIKECYKYCLWFSKFKKDYFY